MSAALELASGACLLTGAVFSVIGGIGLLRMPGFYARTHAAGITDTAGAGLVLLGLALHAGLSLVSVKLLMILLFLYLTSPTSTHALVKAAYADGVAFAGMGAEAGTASETGRDDPA